MNKYQVDDIRSNLLAIRDAIDAAISLVDSCEIEPTLLYEDLARFARQASFPKSFFDEGLHGLSLNTFASLVIYDYKQRIEKKSKGQLA